MVLSADRDGRYCPLRAVMAALSPDFPCQLSFKQIFDRQGVLRLVPVLFLELGEADYRALQDVTEVKG